MLSFEPLHASIGKTVFEILETPLGHAVGRPEVPSQKNRKSKNGSGQMNFELF